MISVNAAACLHRRPPGEPLPTLHNSWLLHEDGGLICDELFFRVMGHPSVVTCARARVERGQPWSNCVVCPSGARGKAGTLAGVEI